MTRKLSKVRKNNKIAINFLFCLLISLALNNVNSNSTDNDDISIDIGVDFNPNPQFYPDFPPFSDYVNQFDKGYQPGTVEFETRQQIYNGWKQHWMEKYEAGQLTFKVGATERSDWTQEQRDKTKPLIVEEPVGKQDKIEQIHKLSQSAGNPVTLDWRKRNVITSIKNQGSCGSCWTFATAAYGESRLIMKGKQDINVDLSEQFLLSCTPECSCGGGYLEYVFEEASNGIPTESEYPYDPYGIISPFICWTGDKKRIGYIPNKKYDLSTSELETLLQSGPIAISISATDWEDYKGGIFKCNSYDKVNHAVLLIGYDQNTWLVKNQWGDKWGQDGYIRVTKDRLHNCKIGASAFWMWESSTFYTLFGMLFAILAFQF